MSSEVKTRFPSKGMWGSFVDSVPDAMTKWLAAASVGGGQPHGVGTGERSLRRHHLDAVPLELVAGDVQLVLDEGASKNSFRRSQSVRIGAT